MLKTAGIVITKEERANIEAANARLGSVERPGAKGKRRSWRREGEINYGGL